MAKHRAYLDYAAATPLDPRVRKKMEPFWSEVFDNPSGLTMQAKHAKDAINEARAEIAKVMGAKPHQVIFTSGATEANNLVIKGANNPAGDQLLISSVEHDSVFEPAMYVGAQTIPVNTKGVVDLGRLEKLVTDKVSLISVIYINNETGAIQPIARLAQLIGEINKDRQSRGVKKLLLHTDAAQAPAVADLSVSRLGIDFMTLSSAKIYGPKGVGCLYVRDRRLIKPQITGGGQEYGMRSGTEPTPLIAGFGEAMRLISGSRDKHLGTIIKLREGLISDLTQTYPDVVLNSPKEAAPHIVNIRLPGADGEKLTMALDQMGVQVATGAACSAGGDKPSRVLSAMGLSTEETRSSLRVSLSHKTKESDLRLLMQSLSKVRPQALPTKTVRSI